MTIPRKAPTSVVEQRITLGDLERSHLMPILDETGKILKTGRVVAQGAAIATSTAAVVAAGGAALACYGVYAWLVDDGVLDKIGTFFGDAWDNFTWPWKQAAKGVGASMTATGAYAAPDSAAGGATVQNPDTGQYETDTSKLEFGGGSWAG